MDLFLGPRAVALGATLAVLSSGLIPGEALAGGPRPPPQSCAAWDNGPAGDNGQISHLGGDVSAGLKAADDFYLCPGSIYRLESITASMATTSHPYFRRAILEFYSDCNGCPDELLFTLENPVAVEGPTLPDGFVRVDYTFTIADQVDPALRSIILDGGTYWVSAIGLTDGQSRDSSAFLISTGEVKGRPAKKRIGVESPFPGGGYTFPDPWVDTDDCCIGCHDLSFRVEASACKVLIDNGEIDTGPVAGGVRSESSDTIRDSRGADDFAVGTCTDVDVCYIRACIWTNCTDFEGIAEIYSNDCKEPGEILGETPLFTRTATRITPLDVAPIVIEGRTVRAYQLDFELFDIGPNGRFLLPRARHYWLAVSVRDTFSTAERAYFCYKADCGLCPIRFNPAQRIFRDQNNLDQDNKWLPVEPERELAFLIAVEPIVDPPIPSEGCAPDINHDNRVTVQDLFDFLAAWFVGCP